MKRWYILPLVAMLGACSQAVETRISSKGQADGTASFLFSQDVVQSTDLMAARKLVTDSLVSRGYTPSDSGVLHLEVSASERPAAIAIGTASGPASLSAAKHKKPLQSCEDREYRLGIVLTRISDGALVYQSSAAEYHCNLPMAKALPALVTAALADLGSPRGEYSVRRNAPD